MTTAIKEKQEKIKSATDLFTHIVTDIKKQYDFRVTENKKYAKKVSKKLDEALDLIKLSIKDAYRICK